MTKVVNIKKLPKSWVRDDDYVYIGRAGNGQSGYFGNPFTLKSENKRQEVLDQYRAYLEKKLEEDQEFRSKVRNLRGKTLVCFCKPKLCHGDILAEWAEKLS